MKKIILHLLSEEKSSLPSAIQVRGFPPSARVQAGSEVLSITITLAFYSIGKANEMAAVLTITKTECKTHHRAIEVFAKQ